MAMKLTHLFEVNDKKAHNGWTYVSLSSGGPTYVHFLGQQSIKLQRGVANLQPSQVGRRPLQGLHLQGLQGVRFQRRPHQQVHRVLPCPSRHSSSGAGGLHPRGPPPSPSEALVSCQNEMARLFRALKHFDFDLVTVKATDFDDSVFEYVKIDLGNNIRTYAASLSKFIQAGAYGMFNDRTAARMLDVAEAHFKQTVAILKEGIEAKKTLASVKAIYDKYNPQESFCMTDAMVRDLAYKALRERAQQ